MDARVKPAHDGCGYGGIKRVNGVNGVHPHCFQGMIGTVEMLFIGEPSISLVE